MAVMKQPKEKYYVFYDDHGDVRTIFNTRDEVIRFLNEQYITNRYKNLLIVKGNVVKPTEVTKVKEYTLIEW